MSIPQRKTADILRSIATDSLIEDEDFKTLTAKLVETAESGAFLLDDAYTSSSLASLLTTAKQTNMNSALQNLGYTTSAGTTLNDTKVNWQS